LSGKLKYMVGVFAIISVETKICNIILHVLVKYFNKLD